MRRTLIHLLMLWALTHSRTAAQDMDSVEARVAAAADTFVDAFNDLDWERFQDAWTEDATAFLPTAGTPARLTGRDTIVSVFQAIFGDFPARFDGPPYLSIDPIDRQIDVFGNAAVVTFHLGDDEPRSRRTLVFVREGDAWRIAHLHASDPPD